MVEIMTRKDKNAWEEFVEHLQKNWIDKKQSREVDEDLRSEKK